MTADDRRKERGMEWGDRDSAPRHGIKEEEEHSRLGFFLADPHCESMQFMVEGRDFITL